MQPAASAGATLRVIMLMGKFQGVMAATTPTGCLMASMRRSCCTVAKMSPSTLLPSSANHSIDAALHGHTHVLGGSMDSMQVICMLMTYGGIAGPALQCLPVWMPALVHSLARSLRQARPGRELPSQRAHVNRT